MAWIASARRAVLLALLSASALVAQTTLPPTTATALPVATPSPVPLPDPITPAEVRFTSGKLHVVATGSGLNQILREIARLTSITINGRVNEERVFGTYGPGTPGEVISSLLDGTGTNMLLRESTPTRPGELILTPRSGSVTPPNPESFQNNSFQLPPRQSYQRPPSYPIPPPPVPAVQPQQPPPVNPAAPSGPQTPEQIYQQLQRIQQAQPHP